MIWMKMMITRKAIMIENEEEELNRKRFNAKQKEAVLSGKDENVLISAGAGSGKTKTLSYKVYRMITNHFFEPSQVLVLTFTNKAAFEMKERIIKEFRTNQKDPKSTLEDEILSSHIQTFDSFSMYLVKKYAKLLNLPDNIQIADDAILNTKKNEILDEILSRHYREDFERTVRVFSKYCTADASFVKNLIFKIDKAMSGLLPLRKENFLREYESLYLSREKFNQLFDEFIQHKKEKILEEAMICYFRYQNHDVKMDEEEHIKRFAQEDFYQINAYVQFEDKGSNEIMKAVFDLLSTKSEAFLDKAYHYFNDPDKKDLFNGNKNRTKKEYKDEHEDIYKPMCAYLKQEIQENLLKKCGLNLEQMYETVLSFKDDISLFIEIIQEMNQKLNDYKVMTNAFTFSDIGSMAISLVSDKRYQQAGDEIKKRFKYILVDEYQDTNDIQETFLNSFRDQSTLFCVGDAKQSIYRFRNANVQLFMDRKTRYEQDPNQGKVIDMNWNYRSSFELLANINSIFCDYMTKNHGGIFYAEETVIDGKTVKPQSLEHDPKVQRTNHPDSFYGLGLLTFLKDTDRNDAELEAISIINDIKDKVLNRYQVRDGSGFRDCRYSDFAILMRVQRGFDTYQKLFDEASIPCNIKTTGHLIQINAILLLQSLIRLIGNRIASLEDENFKNEENTKHLFLSVARSYIYGKDSGYTDKKIDAILNSDDKNAYLKDPIFEKIDHFAIAHRYSALSIIFLDMIEEFQILEKLPEVGDVLSNVDKIESFYQIVLSQESVGSGIRDFVNLFKNISRYKVDLGTENDSEIENAVKIMTIHGSKGLEFPIVYMPYHYNSIGKTIHHDGDVDFSMKYGIMLPNFKMDEKVNTITKAEYLELEGSNDEEINEHVRIFYVALTRAEEALYIVCNKDPMARVKSKETLLDMLDHVYHAPVIQKPFLDWIQEENIIPEQNLKAYSEQIKETEMFYRAKPDFERMNESFRNAAKDNYDEIRDLKQQSLKNAMESFQVTFAKYCIKSLDFASEDAKARYYAIVRFNDDTIHTKAELVSRYSINWEDFADFYQESLSSIIFVNNKKEESVKNFKALFAITKALRGIPGPFYTIEYDKDVISAFDGNISWNQIQKDKKYVPLEEKNPALVNDEEITGFEVIQAIKQRASKTVSDNEDIKSIQAMDYGTRLHQYLEAVDYLNPDLSFIENREERKVIQKVLDLDFFSQVKEARIYQEYSYYDPDFDTTGSIDLLLVYKDHIDIVDYKTSHIDDPDYVRQLNVYRRNVERIFSTKNIRMYLLSIVQGKMKEVQKQEIE